MITPRSVRLSPRGAARAADRDRAVARALSRYHAADAIAVTALAGRHPYLADLAVSFPALLHALAVPRLGLSPPPVVARVIGGAKLAELASMAGLPLWARALPAHAFRGALQPLPDGELVRRQIRNHVAVERVHAGAWVSSVAMAHEIATPEVAVWVAREAKRGKWRFTGTDLRLVSLWAWFSLNATDSGIAGVMAARNPWTPAFGYEQATAAARLWAERLDLHCWLDGLALEPWLEAGEVDGFSFVPLLTCAEIDAEAEAMRNCVRSYASSIARGSARLWGILRDGQRIATVGIRRTEVISLEQVRASNNGNAPREVTAATLKWFLDHGVEPLLAINAQTMAQDMPWHLNGARWRSLWRPYWLARRRIPQWLPLEPSSSNVSDMISFA